MSSNELCNLDDITNYTYATRNQNDFHNLIEATQQVKTIRSLSKSEESILKTINTGIGNWYEPWRKTYLDASREFNIVYDLMEGLLHYEYQITNSRSVLSNDRINATAQAVARLIDCGNAILNIDLVVRVNDEVSSEIDPVNVTTIELFHAHVKAHVLREKLQYDYFKKERPQYSYGLHNDDTANISTTTSFLTLQVPMITSQSQCSPSLERSHRSSIGSNTSINTLSDGRRTPQQSIPYIEMKLTQVDLTDQSDVSHLKATIRSNAFAMRQNSPTRLTLLPEILSEINNLLSMPTNPDKTQNCFEVLDALLDVIEKLPVESRGQEVNMIANTLLKPLVRKVYIDDRESLVDFQHAHWTACLLSMIRLMTASDFNRYLRHFNNLADLSAFLRDYLFIVRRFVSKSQKQFANSIYEIDTIKNPVAAYPSYWIEMILLTSSTFLTSLTYLYQILRQIFATNLQIWTSFIDCLVHFILQDALNPKRFMLKDRQRLLADDLRHTSADYVWISWDSLGLDQKQQLLEDIAEPLLRVCMTLESKQRSILLPIFYDMMLCDYTSQYVTSQGSLDGTSTSTIHTRREIEDHYREEFANYTMENQLTNFSISKNDESLPYLSFREVSQDGTVLTKFTHLIVGKLNMLMIDNELGDQQFKDELCAAISGDLNPKYHNRNSSLSHIEASQFRCMAKHTSELLAEFLQICLDVRQANKSSYKHLYLLCLFKLILFFRDKVNRSELYLNYLYKLCQIHYSVGRFVEAGYTLLEHAKALPWSDDPLETHHRIITRYFQIPQQLNDYTGLKMFLYDMIVEYFDQGQLWEPAVPLCREMIDVFQYKTYEYDKLAKLMQKMSIYFNNITGSRANSEYFRVTFHGIGFPCSIRNVTMVYRGKPYEKLGDFQATILNKYPDAKLLTTLAKPDESLINQADARYLQINACTPVVDIKAKFNTDLSKIDESILSYYKFNECDKFCFSRRITGPTRGSSKHVMDDSFANMWRERTTLTTNTLPGILPFFPVFLIETSIRSPIENAIEDLERTNDRLSCMVNRFKVDKRHKEDARLLGQLLLGIVDAAVNGGITKYEEAFFTSSKQDGCYAVRTPSESNFEANPVSREEEDEESGYKQQASNNSSLVDDLHAFLPTTLKPSGAQVDKLKCLIAQQVPLLDEAIRLHNDRVADVMRPQHEHLEVSYKRLKHHVMTKYSRYLPADYSRSTLRSYRSLARSPNRSMRSESRLYLSLGGGSSSRSSAAKRMSDVGIKPTIAISPSDEDDRPTTSSSSSIPYQQLCSERRSLPFLTGIPISSREISKDTLEESRAQQQLQSPSPGSTPESSDPIETYPKQTLVDVRHHHRIGNVVDENEAYIMRSPIEVASKQLYTRFIDDHHQLNHRLSGDDEDEERSAYKENGRKISLILEDKDKSKAGGGGSDEVKLVSF